MEPDRAAETDAAVENVPVGGGGIACQDWAKTQKPKAVS